MSNKSKQKGNRLEREVVKSAIAAGFSSKRAWGSNGQSIGLPFDVDVVINDKNFQCKSRKRLPKIFLIPESCYGTILKQNNGKPYVLLYLEDYYKLIDYYVLRKE